ncbi:MipA/OmpV family protein [Rhizobium sp. 0TCS1.26]|uniref:MipA/OmpV family protein n=1 Tax=Rhizobium sp. 0TCS1.26 TaxID=3142623 RepID=UPI003D268206
MSLLQRTHRRLHSSALSGVVGVTLILAASASIANAADTGLADQSPEPPFDQERFNAEPPVRNWSLIVGAGGSYSPKYEGSDKFEVSPLPVVVFTYGDWLEIDPGGVTVTAYQRDGFALAGRVGYETGRDQDDDDRLRGLGDIDFAATVGAKASYTWQGLELYATVDQTIEGSESLIGTFGAEFNVPVTEKLILGAGIEGVVANDKHMQAYFGVDAIQSANSGLAAYKAEAGLKQVEVSASATYMLSEHWLVRGEASLAVLTGDAADSPIVKDELQPSTSLFVGYKF